MPHHYQPWPQATAQADPPVTEAPAPDAPDPEAPDPDAPDPEAQAPDAPDPDAPDPDAIDSDAIDPDAQVTEATDPDAAQSAPAPDTGTPRPRPLALLILGAVTVILGGFGIWATVHASSLRAQSAQQNTALVDTTATSAVRQQIDSAVQTIFSYSYANTGATRSAAQQLLTGPAIKQYDSLFALVQQQAPAQKLVVVTKVTNSGVELLTGNTARVLIFVNQQDTRAGTSQTSYGGAMLAVTAINHSGHWQIENIDTFTTP